MINLKQIQYHVAYKRKGDCEYQVIKNNPNSWVADPFLFEINDEIYIFAEYFITRKRKGAIAFSKWNGREFGKWNLIIEEAYHLSFPNVFTYKDEIYMCPESSAGGELYLYRAVNFPYTWEKVHTICENVRWVDTVFLKQENNILCFTYDIDDNQNSKGTLKMFNVLNGKVRNVDDYTVISHDDAVARPAGNFIVRNDKLYRVSQNCDKVYGNALVFSECWFEDSKYIENHVRTVKPCDLKINKKYNYIGTHTYNEIDDFQVLDLRSRDFSLSIFLWMCFNRLYRDVKSMFNRIRRGK